MTDLNNELEETLVEAGPTPEEMIEEGVHNYSSEDTYVVPEDPKVRQKLEWFKDQKLALMMHWGAYSQIGIVESWALSDADAYWSRNCIDWDVTGKAFKQEYFDLNKTFNPIRFEPEKWADLALEAGIKYFIFTTKHHDGFCMWDTAYTDYKITGSESPFRNHRYSDVFAHLSEAFRKREMGVIAYFSKADWHIDSYWSEDYDRGSYQYRGPSYNPKDNPEEWQRFVDYTHNQLRELTTKYGQIDGLWFDAGWVCERNGQDIKLGDIIEEIRTYQPGMLSVDRTIGGPYENYVTPEQCVPDEPLNIPWESCITLGTSFSFVYEDTYKSPREVVNLLVDIVAKGGNLAINVGPQPDGRLPKGAIASLKGLGVWMKQYGDAVYGTRVCAPYKVDNIAFTQKEGSVYAIELFTEAGQRVPDTLVIPYDQPVKLIKDLVTGQSYTYKKTQAGYEVTCPYEGQDTPIARVFVLS